MQSKRSGILLGIECGGTHTVALKVHPQGRLMERREFGAANFQLLTSRKLRRHLQSIAQWAGTVDAIGLGIAGLRTETERNSVRRMVQSIWKRTPATVVNDLETALLAPGPIPPDVGRVVVISGTGSCSFGKTACGAESRCGGWGHLLGDRGSAYDIAFNALRSVIREFDRTGRWPRLGSRLLRALQMTSPEEWISWMQSTSKDAVAALAVEVFAAARQKDRIATETLKRAVNDLTEDAVCCAEGLGNQREKLEMVFVGSVLLKQPRFAEQLKRSIRNRLKSVRFVALQRETAWGAVELAGGIAGVTVKPARQPDPATALKTSDISTRQLSITEQRHPDSMDLDRMSSGEIIELMLREDGRLPQAVLKERQNIEKAIRMVVRSFRNGGRLFYVGAGTSGRLGILDASECPPTFRTDPEMVQGIIAGGQRAIGSAIEGAEDDAQAGAQAVVFRGVARNDVVIGIAASGRTPFVHGALQESRRLGARTGLICFNPALELPRKERPDVLIGPDIGPEILTGSTRLKAGTATKLILNMLTTISMIRLGKVVGNLMVDLNPSNEKLRDRAIRIVCELTGVERGEAAAALEKKLWNVKAAVEMLR